MSQIVFYMKWTKDVASIGESVANHLYQCFLLVTAHYYVIASSQFSATDCFRQWASYFIEKAHLCRIVAVLCHMTCPKNIGASCVLPQTTDKFLNTATVAYKNDRLNVLSIPSTVFSTYLHLIHRSSGCHLSVCVCTTRKKDYDQWQCESSSQSRRQKRLCYTNVTRHWPNFCRVLNLSVHAPHVHICTLHSALILDYGRQVHQQTPQSVCTRFVGASLTFCANLWKQLGFRSNEFTVNTFRVQQQCRESLLSIHPRRDLSPVWWWYVSGSCSHTSNAHSDNAQRGMANVAAS